MLRNLIQSHSARAGVIYGIGGVCFSLGNLLLARGLTTQDFATVSVILAVVQIATCISLLGTDTVIIRNPVNPSTWLAARILLSSAVTAVAASLFAWQIYEFSPLPAVFLAYICVAATANLLGAAYFRSRERFLVSLALTQGHNAILVLAGLVILISGTTGIALPLGIIFLAYLGTAVVGWIGSRALPHHPDALSHDQFPWREGRTIVVSSLAVIILVQMERLVLPVLLDSRALATFAVLAAVAGSPFRVLQMGIGYTLLPQLRSASAAQHITQVLWTEIRTAGWLTAAAVVAVWLFANPVVSWSTGGKYELSRFMIGASVAGGIAKIAAAFGRSCIVAFGQQGDLDRFRNASWIAVSTAIACAVVGSNAGLEGVLFGVAIGWIVYASHVLLLARPLVRGRIGAPR